MSRLSLLVIALFAWQLSAPANAQNATPAGETLPSGMVLVETLEKPADAKAFNEDDFAGYLLAYHKDRTHSIYFAVSPDGYSFTDINGGEPVIDGARIAEQKGVRDPYICRGPDGAFYLAATDMHVSGQRAGVRDTQWQRPEADYGWGNNRALVMMKSYDLLHWSHSDFRIDQAFPEFAEVGCSWAPCMIFDEQEGKMLISWTMKLGHGVDHLYWAYTDGAFTKMVTTPKILYRFPEPSKPESELTSRERDPLHVIDSDITRVGDKYHLFYSSKESGTPGIEHTVSDKLTSGYPLVQEQIDPERASTEAPNLFKRLGTDTYVLMYDVYGAGRMGFSETTDFETFKNIGYFNDGPMKMTNFNGPKHAAITYLTKAELDGIVERWKLELGTE